MDEQIEERVRTVDSRYTAGPSLSFGTQLLLVVSLALTVGVAVLCWVLAPALRRDVTGMMGALGAYAWLWMTLLIILAVGSVLALLRKFGLVKVVSDLVDIVIRLDQQRLAHHRLNVDAKTGKYAIPISLAEENPYLLATANPAVQSPVVVNAASSRRGRGKADVQVSEEQTLQQQQQAVIQWLQATGAFPQFPALQQLVAPGAVSNGQRDEFTAVSSVRGSDELKTAPLEVWESMPTVLEGAYTRRVLPGRYDFREELQAFTPSLSSLFLGRSADGPMLMPAGKIWHLVTAGPTGVGKSKIYRLLYSQLIALNMECYICDPHYVPISQEENGEEPLDWTPIESRLAAPPMRDPAEIAEFLEWLVVKKMKHRQELAYHSQPLGTPVFVALDELAAVVDERPEAARYIGLLLRQARKFRICLILAAQGLLVKSIGLDTDMMENIRTGYYGGGDWRTAKIALSLGDGEKVDETGLGNGLVYLKTLDHRATRVRVPWPDNEAVEYLCGLSTLPVREIKRAPLPESALDEVVYERQPEGEGAPGEGERPSNIWPLPVRRGPGAQPKPINPEHLEYVRSGGGFELGNKRLAVELGITEHQAGKIKDIVADERRLAKAQEEESVNE